MDRFSHRGDRRGRQWPRELLDGSDEQLVRLVLAGDEEAFELLFDRHVADAFWFARERLDSDLEAEEAVGHSFAAARAYLAARDRGVEFGPWLRTILGNHCLAIIQARGPSPRRSGTVVDLAAWRRRRGPLGIALPSLAGVRDGMLALCEIGGTGTAATGAAGGGASLLAGTLAKVAVAALLVGGAGAAGKAVVERAPPERGAVAADEASAHGSQGGRGGLRLLPAEQRVSLERAARELVRTPAEAGAPVEPPAQSDGAPVVPVSDVSAAPAPTPTPAAHGTPAPGTPQAAPSHPVPSVAVPETGRALLKEVERVAVEALPPLEAEPPDPLEIDPPLPAPVVEVVEGLAPVAGDPAAVPELLAEEPGLIPRELAPPSGP